ncbi:MAG: BrnT family toxin [Terracidiphilus sp.]|jgi:uncharacterized DUF497 family protein
MESETVRWPLREGLEFEWDSAKAVSNLRDHRITFPFASRVFLDPFHQQQLDTREEYGEERWMILGRVDEWVLMVVYTIRGSNIRLISARKANRNETKIYWE